MAVPSRLMVSPYVHTCNNTVVSSQEMDVYKVVIDFSESSYTWKDAIDYKKVRVTFGALGRSLQPAGRV